MAKALITLGGEIDVASGEELADSVLDIKRHSDRLLKAEKPIIRPLMGSIPASAAGTNTAYFAQTPPAWAEWHILQYAVGMIDDHTTPLNITQPNQNAVQGAVGNGTGGSAVSSAFNCYLTGFDVTLTAATAAYTVTVSNVLGGNLVFNVPSGQLNFSMRFPGTGLLQTGGFATVTVSTTVGVGPGNVIIYTQPIQQTVVASLYTGDPFNPMLGTVKIPAKPVPGFDDFGEKRIVVHSGEYVFWVFYNCLPNQLIWSNMLVAEYNVGGQEMMRV